ncbi:MAG: hypothetical protein M0C28_32320 [Candidatus Moduliflexus flocculans]|nr:hypothetical protein [Candidatus Moduliflexus flocculans]
MAHDGGRDRGDRGEDAVRIVLDPFQDRRNAYLFSVNPRGAKSEGLATGEHFEPGLGRPLGRPQRHRPRRLVGRDRHPLQVHLLQARPRELGPQRRAGHRPAAGDRPPVRRPDRRLLHQSRRGRPARRASAGVRQGLGLTFKPYGLVSPAKDHVAGYADRLALGRRVRPLQELHPQLGRGLQLQHRFRRDRGRRAPAST